MFVCEMNENFIFNKHSSNSYIFFFSPKDLHGMVMRLAEFLDRELSEQAVDAIVNHCTFDSMRSNKMVNREKLPISDIFDMSKSKFMRKGTFIYICIHIYIFFHFITHRTELINK